MKRELQVITSVNTKYEGILKKLIEDERIRKFVQGKWNNIDKNADTVINQSHFVNESQDSSMKSNLKEEAKTTEAKQETNKKSLNFQSFQQNLEKIQSKLSKLSKAKPSSLCTHSSSADSKLRSSKANPKSTKQGGHHTKENILSNIKPLQITEEDYIQQEEEKESRTLEKGIKNQEKEKEKEINVGIEEKHTEYEEYNKNNLNMDLQYELALPKSDNIKENEVIEPALDTFEDFEIEEEKRSPNQSQIRTEQVHASSHLEQHNIGLSENSRERTEREERNDTFESISSEQKQFSMDLKDAITFVQIQKNKHFNNNQITPSPNKQSVPAFSQSLHPLQNNSSNSQHSNQVQPHCSNMLSASSCDEPESVLSVPEFNSHSLNHTIIDLSNTKKYK